MVCRCLTLLASPLMCLQHQNDLQVSREQKKTKRHPKLPIITTSAHKCMPLQIWQLPFWNELPSYKTKALWPYSPCPMINYSWRRCANIFIFKGMKNWTCYKLTLNLSTIKQTSQPVQTSKITKGPTLAANEPLIIEPMQKLTRITTSIWQVRLHSKKLGEKKTQC